MSRDSGVKKSAGRGDGFVSDAGRVERGDESAHASHGEQDIERTHKDGSSISREDVIRILREEAIDNALPSLPAIPGWHVCWVSTTNSSDTPAMRERLGYVPIEHNEIPGFDANKIHSGDHAGKIVCNEMIAYKVPLDIYQEIMKIRHHDMPSEQADSIYQNVQGIKQETGAQTIGGHDADIGDLDGFERMNEQNRRRAKEFT